MKLVITMSRRFGTGASIIATELSKRLEITTGQQGGKTVL